MSALRLRAAAVTHAGKVRAANQDCVAVGDWLRTAPMNSPVLIECVLDEPYLCLVADGMGGQAAGEVASISVSRLLSSAARSIHDRDSLAAAIAAGNERLFQAMQASPALAGMGTTIAGLLVCSSGVLVFNVGDSRVYTQSGAYLRLLSTDDTATFDRSDSADPTGRHGHAVLQCLGGAKQFTPVEPHIELRPAFSGDRYLLCSDGLTDMLTQDELEECLVADLVDSTNRLKNAALAAGGLDNLSIILIDLLE